MTCCMYRCRTMPGRNRTTFVRRGRAFRGAGLTGEPTPEPGALTREQAALTRRIYPAVPFPPQKSESQSPGLDGGSLGRRITLGWQSIQFCLARA